MAIWYRLTEERLDGLGAQYRKLRGYCSPIDVTDRAFEWLERAYLQRDSGLPQMQSWPLPRNLHGDARWEPFLQKMGLSR